MKKKIYTLLTNLLTKIQGHLQTDIRYLIRGGFWMGTGGIINTATSFILSLVMANFLSKTTYGEYKYIISIIPLITLFSLSGMGKAITQSTARNKNILLSATKKKFIYSIPSSIICLILAIFFYKTGQVQKVILFLFLGATFPFLNGTNTFIPYLVGKKKFKESSLQNSSIHILTSSTLILTTLYSNNPTTLIMAYILSLCIAQVFFLKKILKKIKTEACTAKKFSIKYTKHLSLINIINTVGSTVDKVVVFHLLGASELAVYSFSLIIPEQIKSFVKIIPQLAFPKFSSGKFLEIKKSLPKKMLVFGLFLCGISIFYILLAPCIISFVFPKYTESIQYSQLLTLSLITGATSPIYTLLTAKKKKSEMYTYTLTTSVVNIATVCVGTYFYGLPGTIIARILSRFSCSTLLLIILKRTKK